MVNNQWPVYLAEQHQTWGELFSAQVVSLKNLAVPEFWSGLLALELEASTIPDLDALCDKLFRLTGWTIFPAKGLLPDFVYYQHLARRQMPVSTMLRGTGALAYIDEPDLFHDVFGHLPLLADASYANAIAEVGRQAEQAGRSRLFQKVCRLYWYIIECGLQNSKYGLRINGSSLLSSAGEAKYCLGPEPHHLILDAYRIGRTKYDIGNYQKVYFVQGSEKIESIFYAALEEIRRPLELDTDLEPDALIRTDAVLIAGREQGRFLNA
jgi:phenylalanine-4-hydroxylase